MNSQPTEVFTYDRLVDAVFCKAADEFGGLGNMAPGYPIRLNGLYFLTSEALYQACRFPHKPELQRLIASQRSPVDAKTVAHDHEDESRPDWMENRIAIMNWVVWTKFAHNWSAFADVLASTGERNIVELSYRDAFWGAMPDGPRNLKGQNVLGRILQRVRQDARAIGYYPVPYLHRPTVQGLLINGLDALRPEK